MRIATVQPPAPPRAADRVVVTQNAAAMLDDANLIEPVSMRHGAYANHLGESIITALTPKPGAPLAEANSLTLPLRAGSRLP